MTDISRGRPNPEENIIGSMNGITVVFGRFSYGLEEIVINNSKVDPRIMLIVGQFCSIAKSLNVFLIENHRTDWVTTFPFGHVFKDQLVPDAVKGHPATKGGISIGNDVWVGANVTILSGVTIGDGAILAANATVTKDVAPYEIVAGNPARSIRKRFDADMIELLMELRWWDLPVESIREIHKQLCSEPTHSSVEKLIAAYR